MAIVSMAPAVSGAIASSAEYNKHIANIIDLDSRVTSSAANVTTLTTNQGTRGAQGPIYTELTNVKARVTTLETNMGTWAGGTAISRIVALETLTTDTATNGGQGNAQLANRLGTGVGTGSNVITGSASAQLADLRSRVGVLESGSAGALGEVVYVSVTANSSTWNSATEVLTNLVASFTAVSGKKYRVNVNASINFGGTPNSGSTSSLRLRWANAGTITSAGTLIVAAPTYGTTPTANVRVHVSGDFTATASGTVTVGVFGMNPGGDTNVSGLYGSASTASNGLSTNTMSVDRVT
jgi:hypothetical protein